MAGPCLIEYKGKWYERKELAKHLRDVVGIETIAKELKSKASRKPITPEESSNYANLTEDSDGNFVFFHRGGKDYETIKKSTGKTLATGGEEAAALGRAGGAAMYYTRPGDFEQMVRGERKYAVKVPKDKVYDFNSDPENLIEEARSRFKEENPGIAFSPNDQLAYMTKIAGEKGYDMVVAEWDGKTRAQTTTEFKPTDVEKYEGDIIREPFKEKYESNTDKGYEPIIPETKDQKLKEVYKDINKERNSQNKYDKLYRLNETSEKMEQSEITKMIEESDISQELKDKYNEALNYKEEKRRSEKSFGDVGKRISEIKSDTKNEFGETFKPDGKVYSVENKDDIVTLASENVKPKDLTTDKIIEFKNKFKNIIDNVKDSKIGVFRLDNGDYSIDLNTVVDAKHRKNTVKFAKENNQVSIYNGKEGEIKTGGTGETTITDQAEIIEAANKIVNGEPHEFKKVEVKPQVKSKLEAFKAKHIEPVAKAKEGVRTSVENAKKALTKLLPNIEIITHENSESFKEVAGKDARGFFDSENGKIHINLEKANARTVAHEVFHALLLDKVKSNENIQNITKKMVEAVSKSLDKNPELKAQLEDFIKNYSENIKNEEKMSELFGHLAEGYEGFDAPTKSFIKRALDKIAVALGLKPFTDAEVVDMLNTVAGKLAAGEEITERDIKAISEGASSYISEPVNVKKFQALKEEKVKLGDHKLSFVKKSDIIDFNSLMKDISDKKQKVWFWVADQLGRGNYFDKVVDGEHYLDAGPSFALDPVNRDKNVIWATGKNEKEIGKLIGNSDYIFIISGSPVKSKLFNKSVIDIVAKRAGDFNTFKKDVLESSKIKSINDILSSVESWEELKDSVKRKEFLLAVLDQEGKNTPLKNTLEKYNSFVDMNELRDGFYKDNNFDLNDVMLVLKPTGFGGKSEHSTYENNILGDVVGVPDIKVNAFDIMPSELKNKYREDLGKSQQQQAVAPYGIGIKQIERFQESGDYADMKDIVKDLIDDGKSISDIKKIISSELGPEQVSLAERAHNELMEAPKEEKVTSIKNEVTASEREAKGLAPVEQFEKYNAEQNFNRTKERIDSGEMRSPRDLAQAIVSNPKGVPITHEVSDALAYDRMRLSNEYDQALKDLERDPTDAANALRVERIEKEIENNDNAARISGTISAHALLARKNAIKNDYTLDRMVLKYKAKNNGEISAEKRAEFKAISEKLKEAEAKLEQYEKNVRSVVEKRVFNKIKKEAASEGKKGDLKAERQDLYSKLKELSLPKGKFQEIEPSVLPENIKPILNKLAKNLIKDGVTTLEGVVSDIHENLKDVFEGVTERDIRDMLSGYGEQKVPTKNEIEAGLREIKSQGKLLSSLEDLEAGKIPFKSIFQRSKPSERVAELRKQVQQLMKQNGINREYSEEKALATLKTRLKNREAELQEKLDTGNFEKKERRITQPDEEAMNLKANINKLKNKVDVEIKKRELASRSKYKKALDFAATMRRTMLLTGIKVLGKLSTAALSRTIISPIEEITGGVMSQLPLLSKISKQAPREGKFNPSAEVKAISQWWQKATYKDMREIIKSGKGTLDLLHGKEDIPPSVLDFFGQLHQALKQPAKRNEYFRSFEKRMDFAEKNGVDIMDPMVQATISTQAYMDANRAIFMQDNIATKAYKSFISSLERGGNVGETAATGLKIILPIVKVPTNYVGEVTSYAGGYAKALPLIGKALIKGTKSLTPEQSDYVMRNLKKGSLGAAMIALGYFNASAIGGYYQRGEKREEGDVKAGGLRLFGEDMPKWMVHTPLFEMLQIGATLKRVQNKYEEKGKEEGKLAAGLAVTKGLVEEVPFARSPEEALRALSGPEQAKKYAEDLGESFINPQLTQEFGLKILKDEKKKEEDNNFGQRIIR